MPQETHIDHEGACCHVYHIYIYIDIWRTGCIQDIAIFGLVFGTQVLVAVRTETGQGLRVEE